MVLLPELAPMLTLWKLGLVTTWLGCFGHILWKGTKLWSNLPGAAKCLAPAWKVISIRGLLFILILKRAFQIS